MPDDFERAERQEIPVIDIDRRVGFAEVESGYSEQQAEREAERCLKCNINTIFDADTCILCGGCVDVCPENCLRLVDVARLDIQNNNSLALNQSEGAFAILKDETICIRCGLCAKRCPTGAITMEGIMFDEFINA